jgi:hypothetical protein
MPLTVTLPGLILARSRWLVISEFTTISAIGVLVASSWLEFADRHEEGGERPLDIDPSLMHRCDGTHHFWRFGKMSAGRGKQRNNTQICEQAHDVGRQVVIERRAGCMRICAVVLDAVLA